MMEDYGFASSVDGVPAELHPIYEDNFDRIGWALFFHSLPREQTELMISMFLGMKPKEIVKLHHFRNMRRFYGMTARLRQSYKEKKSHFLGYE